MNPTVPEPRPSSPIPSYTEQETEPTTWKVQEETTLPPTELPTTGETTNEVTTSQPNTTYVATLTDADVSSPITYDETTQSVSDHVGSQSATATIPALFPTTASPVLISAEVPDSNLSSNGTNGDSHGGIVSFDQDASTGERNAAEISWKVMVGGILLMFVFIMFVVGISYFVKRKGVHNCVLLGVNKKKKRQSLEEEEFGFPEVRMRSRSGELDLSDIRRSIEAGSYNVRTGVIAYGEPFYT